MNELVARRDDPTRQMLCSVTQRRSPHRGIINLATLLGRATIQGRRVASWYTELDPPTAGHVRLPVVEPRWWKVAMLRSRVTELHYITPVANLRSITAHGVLSHNRASTRHPVSVAAEEVQDRRARKRVPGGRPLHDYANLYFDARNPMMYVMYKRNDGRVPLTVLRLDPAILDVPGSVITDGNAASVHTWFSPSPSGLLRLDENRVYADWWDDPDSLVKAAQKRARCAELLVPDRVEPRFILGCYVEHWNRCSECSSQSPQLPVRVNTHVFFK